MATLRVTKKGQIMIPESIRKAEGIEPGSLVTIGKEGEKIVIRKKRESVTSATAGIWAGRIDPQY